MQILLASAKIMNSTTTVPTPNTHLPRFHKEAGQMALELSSLSVEELAQTIPCNAKIALENKLRYQDFFNEEAFLPALLAYYGQAYKCLKSTRVQSRRLQLCRQTSLDNKFSLWPLTSIRPYPSLSCWKGKQSYHRLKARICLLIGNHSSQTSS